MRKYTSAEERASKKRKRPSTILVSWRKYIDFRAQFAQQRRQCQSGGRCCHIQPGMQIQESLLLQRGFSAAAVGKPNFCLSAHAGCYMHKCRCCCSEYPCNSTWPTDASSHLWHARGPSEQPVQTRQEPMHRHIYGS